MHELPVMIKILSVVCRHAQKNGVREIRSITLGVGILSDLEPEWMQKYFDRISQETVAAGAKLHVRRIPALFQCAICQDTYVWEDRKQPIPACPGCGRLGEGRLIAGSGYQVLEMEAI
ncbi:hydrogenase maturation nickel metallochaperone HypA [Desulfobotulus mexicanus]|uniref:Hydrogenase maturation factor HypA n=1 Tax=Desulfobotulus mexicanus TaxID=2586642 RepID=A0A5S5MEY6_9BACT|nr:hydrogenase maturation nickel metallochaperone HypA [Desulfobotulus mexicanus]TYT74264.1 hydrogenase maturation nickel metallochaperone HypA [Desulfobotulus mexicanus]